MKKETYLRALLKDMLKQVRSKSPENIDFSWIESHDTCPGVPDLNYSLHGIENWMELKSGPGFEILPSQCQWFKRRMACGSKPLILINWGQEFFLVAGIFIDELKNSPTLDTCRNLCYRRWETTPDPYELLTEMGRPWDAYLGTQK